MARCAACGKELPENAVSCPACGEDVRVWIGSTQNPAETELLEARLQSAGLPYLKQVRKNGLLGALNGFAPQGADFFVPAKNHAETLRILGREDDGGTAQTAPETGKPAVRGWKSQVLGILIVAVLLALYFGLDALLSFIRHLFGAP